MTQSPSILDLEVPLRNWGSGIDCVRLIASNMELDVQQRAALNWIADNMERNHAEAHAWFDAEYEAMHATKGNGPRAVS